MLNLEGSLSRLDTFKQLGTHVTHENSPLFECSGGTPAHVSTGRKIAIDVIFGQLLCTHFKLYFH